MNTRSLCLTGLATLCLLVTLVSASCPNKCSGHGRCEANDVCACRQNWLGGDCSQRQCAFTRAWVDTAQEENEAHYYAECGNRGSCDRTTGECTCDPGFTGLGCRRMSCPNSCSGHGTCEFIEELAIDEDDKRVNGDVAKTYAAWDTEKIVGCKCDGYYEGHDCSLKMCPKGDDPLTVNGPLTANQEDMKMVLHLDLGLVNTHDSDISLTYYDPYGNSFTTDAVKIAALTASSSTTTDTMCSMVQKALLKLPNHVMDGVTVNAHTTSLFNHVTGRGDLSTTLDSAPLTPTGTIDIDHLLCLITFPSKAGLSGLQHMLKCNVGVDDVTELAGSLPFLVADGGTVDACTVYEYTILPTGLSIDFPLTELAECSNRGICDSTSGDCACFTGHKGLACEMQEALV